MRPEVGVSDGGAWVDLPERRGVRSWRIEGRVSYADVAISWEEEARAGTTLALALPQDAFVDRYQQEWLSHVRLEVTAFDGQGRELFDGYLDPLWVVWDRGSHAPPRWFDRTRRISEAPVGAFSQAARASVAHLVFTDIRSADVLPPRGGR